MKAFLAGLSTGYAIGVIFAPQRGSETRRRLRRKANEIADMAREQAGSLGETAEQVQEQARRMGRRAMQRAREAGSQVSETVQQAARDAGPLLTLNTASREELMEFRGIGPVLADRIIEGRPFASTEQVIQKGILSANLMEELAREMRSAS